MKACFPYLKYCLYVLWGLTACTGTAEKELAQGRKLYVLQCARCHGMDAGGGNGPSLRRAELLHAPDDQRLRAVIRFGIPGTEMPGTWLLSPTEVRQLAAYVRSLGKNPSQPLAGDARAGRELYEKQLNCASCHSIHGQGGTLDVHSGRQVWEFRLPTPLWAGLMSTAGKLVFGSINEGNFFALHAATGQALWDFQLGAPIRSNPISYQVDGKQYIAISAGSAFFVFGL